MAEAVVQKDPQTGKDVAAPKRRIYRKKDGTYWIMQHDPATGKPLGFMEKLKNVDDMLNIAADELMLSATGNQAVNRAESALPPEQRLLVKNLLEPESAKDWARKNGLLVQEFGKGWDFGVKANKDDEWRFIDPKATGPREFVMDILDLAYDAGQAATSAVAGTVGMAFGGPPGSAAAGGAVAGGLEALRQKIGSAVMGVDNTNIERVAATALGGAIPTQGTGRAALTAKNFARDLAQESGAMLTRAQETGALSARDIFAQRFMDPLKATEKLPSLSMAADDILARINAWRSKNPLLPQIVEADKLSSQLTDAGVTVDISQVMNDLATLTVREGADIGKALKIGAQASGDIPSEAGKAMDAIWNVLNAGNLKPEAVPHAVLVKIRRMVDKRAKSVGGLGDEKKVRAVVEVLEETRDTLATIEKNSADAASAQLGILSDSGKSYSALMNESSRILDKLEPFYERTGANIRSRSEARDKMVGFINGLYGERKSASMDLLRWWEKHTGTELEPVALRAVTGTKIGDEGAMGAMPRITAVGGVPLANQLDVGLGVAQSMVGLSPRNIMRTAQFLHSPSTVMSRSSVPIVSSTGRLIAGLPTAKIKEGAVSFMASPATRSALQEAIQEAARRATEK